MKILIGDRNTYDDFQMILTSYRTPPPAPKIKLIDLPIGDGSIDMTEAIYGDVSYDNRECEFNFVFLGPVSDRAFQIANLAAYVHGRRLKVSTLDDPDYYYSGRVIISEYEKEGAVVAIKLTMIADPYKYKSAPTIVSGTIPVGGTVALSCTNARMRVIPEITVDAAVSIGFGGNSYAIGAGVWKLTDVAFKEGINLVTITGPEGTAYSITYQEGAI